MIDARSGGARSTKDVARKLRVEYSGAVYRLINRGDRRLFLLTIAEACQKTGLWVHAWCLISNHFHLVAETPPQSGRGHEMVSGHL